MSRPRSTVVLACRSEERVSELRLVLELRWRYRVREVETREALREALKTVPAPICLVDQTFLVEAQWIRQEFPEVRVISFDGPRTGVSPTSQAHWDIPKGEAFTGRLLEALRVVSQRKRGPKKVVVAADELRQRCA